MTYIAEGAIRAFLYLDVVPLGCGLFPIQDDANHPHLQRDEVIVFDCTDRIPSHGEIFVLHLVGARGPVVKPLEVFRWRHGSTSLPPGEWYSFGRCNRPRSKEDVAAWLRSGRTIPTCDGPIRAEDLMEKIVGRVIGLFDPALAVPPPPLPAIGRGETT